MISAKATNHTAFGIAVGCVASSFFFIALLSLLNDCCLAWARVRLLSSGMPVVSSLFIILERGLDTMTGRVCKAERKAAIG